MKALVIFENRLPDLEKVKKYFTDIFYISLTNKSNAHIVPHADIKTSDEGVSFITENVDIFNSDAIIFSNEVLPKEIASKIAFKFGLGVIAHVANFSSDNSSIKGVVHSWQNLGLIIEPIRKPGIFIMNALANSLNDSYIQPQIKPFKSDQLVELISKTEKTTTQEIKSRIVIGIGLGVSKELLSKIFELSELIKAPVVCTRPVADLGYIDRKFVVGDTGISIYPELYIALGISGASQHMSGVFAKKIIAVNVDRNAPIFSKAHVRINQKVEDVLPKVVEWAKNS